MSPSLLQPVTSENGSASCRNYFLTYFTHHSITCFTGTSTIFQLLFHQQLFFKHQLHNFISLLSLREMHSISGISEFFTLSQHPLALIQIAIAIGLFIVHLLGIIGLFIYQINKNISLLFMYI